MAQCGAAKQRQQGQRFIVQQGPTGQGVTWLEGRHQATAIRRDRMGRAHIQRNGVRYGTTFVLGRDTAVAQRCRRNKRLFHPVQIFDRGAGNQDQLIGRDQNVAVQPEERAAQDDRGNAATSGKAAAVQGDKRKSGFVDIPPGTTCKLYCPVSKKPLDKLGPVDDQSGADYYAIYATKRLAQGPCVMISNVWGHYHSRIVDDLALDRYWLRTHPE